MRHFQVTVREIPNQYVKRQSYRETYEIAADNATDAKQSALDKFGDWSQVLPGECVEFDIDFPPTSTHSDPDDE